MNTTKINCCFCWWTGEIDNKLAFICPECGIDFGMLDGNGRQQANQIITESIEKYQTGHSDFAVSEDMAFACSRLMVLSGKSDSAEYKKLSSLLWNKRGVQYSKVFPLIIDFQKKINDCIDRTQGLKTSEVNRIPLRDDELPF